MKAKASTSNTTPHRVPADPAPEGLVITDSDEEAVVVGEADTIPEAEVPEAAPKLELSTALVRPEEPTTPATAPLEDEPNTADKLTLDVKTREVGAGDTTPAADEGSSVLAPSATEDVAPPAPATEVVVPVSCVVVPVAGVVAVAPYPSDVGAVAALHMPSVFGAQHAALPEGSAPQ